MDGEEEETVSKPWLSFPSWPRQAIFENVDLETLEMKSHFDDDRTRSRPKLHSLGLYLSCSPAGAITESSSPPDQEGKDPSVSDGPHRS